MENLSLQEMGQSPKASKSKLVCKTTLFPCKYKQSIKNAMQIFQAIKQSHKHLCIQAFYIKDANPNKGV